MEKLKNIWKNQTVEDRRKLIAYSTVGVLGFGLLFGVYLMKSSENTHEVDDFSNPDAKAGKNYNSRLEANQMDRKDSSNINLAIDEIFGTSKQEILIKDNLEKNTEVYQPDYSAPVNNNQSSGGSSGGHSRRSSTSNYPRYDADDSDFYEEPKKRRYSSSSTAVTEKNSTQQPDRAHETFMENAFQSSESNLQNEVKTVQINARLLSQGYISTGKSISFILLDAVEISGVKTKKGQIISGIAQEQNNRLLVKFSTIKAGGKILPVDMQLYGSDGIEGLPISGAEQNSGDNAASTILNSTVGSIPVVGRIASDAIQNKNRKSSIKLTPNISCTIIYTT